MNPATFLRVLGPEPWRVAYVEPSLRPDDSRYGANPNRVQRHTQFQVILKPDPGHAQELYLGSLSAALGIDARAHDVRFVEDDWESPVLGAWGLGWEVWLDGMEVTQFTYFQQAGGLPVAPVAVEITYGLERILMAVQGVEHFRDIRYSRGGVTYGELFLENEREMSAWNLEAADVERVRTRFELYDAEARGLVERGLAIPAYDHLLKASHAFNVLDARGAVGVAERARFFGRMRGLARQCAGLWVKTRESLGFPLLVGGGAGGARAEEEHVSDGGAAVGAAAAAEARDQLKVVVGEEEEEEASTGAAAPPAHRRTLVVEVGTEEIPAADVASGARQLEAAVTALLRDTWRLEHGALAVHATPRRLALVVEALAPRQARLEREVRGPPASKAFSFSVSDDGSKTKTPTKAAEGFCKKNGVRVDDLYIKKADDASVDYVYARVTEPGRPAVDVVAESIPTVLASLAFSKTMRWGAAADPAAGAGAGAGTYYSRPVRWLLALYGDQVVPLTYAGVRSGRASRVLRTAPEPVVEVRSAEEYVAAVTGAGIALDVAARREAVWSKSKELAASVGGRLVPEDGEPESGLVDEVTNLVEAPVPILGRFDAGFLRLPPEVLTTVMRKHQRYFPVIPAVAAAVAAEGGEGGDLRADAGAGAAGSDTKLLPWFVAVANGNIDEATVRKGNEAVLRARYEDAKFFYDSDLAKPLPAFRPLLSGLTFQAQLGSMLDKSDRLERIVPDLGRLLSLPPAALAAAAAAAPLALADLATAVVTEFTGLAGTMGRHYALAAGFPPAVADAVLEASLPRHAGDRAPGTPAGACLAVALRLDSLVGLFAVGCAPTATGDPFGLRRAAYGLVQAVVSGSSAAGDGTVVDLDVPAAVRVAAGVQPVPVSEAVQAEVCAFVARRLEQLLLDEPGARVECVRAVLAERGRFPALAAASARQLTALFNNSDSDGGGGGVHQVVAAYARPTRIVRGKGVDPAWAVDPALFQSDAERGLWDAYGAVSAAVAAAGGERVPVDAFVRASEGLLAPVDRFFAEVFVMADDEAVRRNRLVLLAKVTGLPKGVADLSLLPGF